MCVYVCMTGVSQCVYMYACNGMLCVCMCVHVELSPGELQEKSLKLKFLLLLIIFLKIYSCICCVMHVYFQKP